MKLGPRNAVISCEGKRRMISCQISIGFKKKKTKSCRLILGTPELSHSQADWGISFMKSTR